MISENQMVEREASIEDALRALAAQLEAECQMPFTVALMRQAADKLKELEGLNLQTGSK